MIEKILRRFGYIPSTEVGEIRERLDLLAVERAKVHQKNRLLELEINGKDAAAKKRIRVMATGVGDVEPTDVEARAKYTIAASNFYIEILEPKLLQMIATAREELDNVHILNIPLGMDRKDYDNVLRGTSNAFKLLMDWGELMKGEATANTTNANNE